MWVDFGLNFNLNPRKMQNLTCDIRSSYIIGRFESESRKNLHSGLDSQVITSGSIVVELPAAERDGHEPADPAQPAALQPLPVAGGHAAAAGAERRSTRLHVFSRGYTLSSCALYKKITWDLLGILR